ncbi:AsmA-like C-terminal region-containing protein [Anaplasma phagocytophilum]|uniref:AsmA-like C-terminal region-containing protein n=1 Tax=Anaplasma phagocytophilum TaxID=948 RepID=UPI00201A85DD
MKFLGYLCGAAIVALATIVGVPYLIDWDARYGDYAFEQLGVAVKDSGVSIKVLGDIRGRFLPPKLIVRNLYLGCDEESKGCSGVIAVERLEIGLSIWSLLKGERKVEYIDLYGLRTNAKSLGDVVTTQAGAGVGKVRIFNSVIVPGQTFEPSPRNAVHVKQSEIKSYGNLYRTNTEFKIGRGKYSLVANVELRNSGDKAATVEITSGNTRVSLSGKGRYDVGAGGRTLVEVLGGFEWLLDVKTSNLGEFSQALSMVTRIDVLGHIHSTEELSLLAEFKHDVGHGFEVSRLDIEGHSLIGNVKGKCNTSMSCSAELTFSFMDIDALIRHDDPDVNIYNTPARGSSSVSFPVITLGMDAKAELDIKEMRYKGGVVRNISSSATISDGKIVVDRLLLDLPGRNNVLHVSGTAVNTEGNTIPRFMGTINVAGEDVDTLISWLFPFSAKEVREDKGDGSFVLRSGFYVAPRIIAFPDINLNSHRANIAGNLKYKYDRGGGVVIGGITVSNFASSDYKMVHLDSKSDNDILSFMWLRNITIPVQVAVKFRDFTIGRRAINELSFLADVSSRRMSIEKIRFFAQDSKSHVSDIRGSASVTLSSQGVRPKVFLNLVGDQYSSEFLWAPKLIDRNSIAAEGGRRVSQEGYSKYVWSSQPINLSSLEGIDGNVNVRLKNMTFLGRLLTDLVMSSTFKEGVMSIDDLHFNQGEGNVKISGNVGMGDVTSLSVVIAASNVALGSEDSDAADVEETKGMNPKGNISVSGTLQMYGRNVLELMNSVKGKLKFAARRLDVSGVDFDGFITDLFNTESKADIASLSRVYLYRGNTVFEKFDGEMQIERGTAVSSLQFRLNSAVGAASINFMIPQFTVTSLCRFAFVPPGGNSPASIDMSLQGYVWQPKPTFDIDRLFELVKSSR